MPLKASCEVVLWGIRKRPHVGGLDVAGLLFDLVMLAVWFH